MKRIVRFFIPLLAICLLTGCNEGGGRPQVKPQPSKDAIHSATPTNSVKPIVNFYIENSASMDGYVKGVTEFEQTIYSYLSDMQIAGITDNLNLFYINSQSIRYASNADIDMISDFIEKLEPATFQKRGGNRMHTDISNVVKMVLKEAEANSISILVSDFIFSPDNTKNPEEYLLNQQIGIKNSIATQFLNKMNNAAIVVYPLKSKFDGQFYYFDAIKGREMGKYFKGDRPFYLWIIGDLKNVAELYKQVPSSNFRNQNVKNIFSVVAGSKEVNYAVKPYSGNFNLSRKNTKTDIENLAKDSRSGKVKFSVNVDFSNLLLNNAYLTDANNYELNNKEYKMSIQTCSPNEHGYTHTLSFTADRVYKGVVSVKLKKQYPLPKWIKDINDTDGSQPELGKTYGIKYLLEGVFEGFTIKSKYYTEIKININ